MAEQAADRVWSGIDIPKTLAGALAAVCAAVLGSFLGVAGTLVGAALASIVGTVGTEIYHRSIKKGTEKLSEIAPTFVRAPAAVGTPDVAAATEEDKPSETVPEAQRGGIRWKRVALITGAVFVLAMIALLAVELLAGKSMASLVGHDSGGRTTFSSVVTGDGGGSSEEQPAPVVSETPSTSTDGTDGTESGTPTTGPTDSTETSPAGTPTTTPTTAPDTGTPDGGTGDGGDGTGDGTQNNTDSGDGTGTGNGTGGGEEGMQQQDQGNTSSE